MDRARYRPQNPAPRIFTPELGDWIVDRVRDGATLADAAEACGVKRETLWHWRSYWRRLPDGDVRRAYVAFNLALDAAREEARAWKIQAAARTLARGASYRAAAEAAGVSHGMVQRWVADGSIDRENNAS